MNIQKITPIDRSEWLRMRRALWPDCAESMHAFEMEEFTKCASTRAVFVVKRDGSGLGGFIELSIRDRVDGSRSPQVAYVEGWYIDCDLRGRGIGRKLMKQAEVWARSHHLAELARDADIENEDSIRAHKALGFHETFRLVHFLKPAGTTGFASEHSRNLIFSVGFRSL